MALFTHLTKRIFEPAIARSQAFFSGLKRGQGADFGKKQAAYDKQLVYSLSKSRIPNLRQLKYIGKYLSRTEKWILRTSFLIIFLNLFYVGVSFYFDNLKIVPIAGGVYTEGLIGFPKYINPLYAGSNDVDNDITSLVYSSIFKRGTNGELANDLIKKYDISEDNKEYLFYLRDDVFWHNKARLTADDVLFTIAAIQDQQYKSPLRGSLAGIRAERLDDYSFKLILSDSYAAFLEILTFGILPADLWAQIPPESALLAELNVKPIGSGPYKFDSLAKDRNGNIQKYSLVRNADYYNETPLIDLSFVFFHDFIEAIAALNANSINGISYLPPDLKPQILTPNAYHYYELYLPQLTVIFFNQERNRALADRAVRQALAVGLDRNQIINTALEGNAHLVDGPILANSFAYNPAAPKHDYNKLKAEELLDSLDWKLAEINSDDINAAAANLESENEADRRQAELNMFLGEGRWRKKGDNYLIIELKTVERKENQFVLEQVKKYWEELGVRTIVEVLPITRINNEVIKTREFDALFYGQVTGADPDPYAFWHSSQTGENGFNIANFANKEADELLEDARLMSDQGERQQKYFRFQEIIAEEVPAIFMYSPVYTYIHANRVKGFVVRNIFVPKDRFSNISDWHLKTGKRLIWKD